MSEWQYVLVIPRPAAEYSCISLDTELTVGQLVHLTAGPFESVFRNRVSANFAADLERFSTLRGLLAIR